MFDKFGKLNSLEELNRAAAAQKAEGDEEALVALALENGLDREDAEDYMDSFVEELATPLQAALGRIKAEAEHLKIDGLLNDWKNAVADLCTADADMQAAVFKKSLCGCMAALIKFSFENKVQVSDKIVDACKVQHNGKLEAMRKPLYLGVPDKATTKKIVMEYYLGEAEG